MLISVTVVIVNEHRKRNTLILYELVLDLVDEHISSLIEVAVCVTI